MQLKEKTIAILLEDKYQDLEVWYPYYRMIEEGATVKFVAPKKGHEYYGKYGYPAKSDMDVEDTKGKDEAFYRKTIEIIRVKVKKLSISSDLWQELRNQIPENPTSASSNKTF